MMNDLCSAAAGGSHAMCLLAVALTLALPLLRQSVRASIESLWRTSRRRARLFTTLGTWLSPSR